MTANTEQSELSLSNRQIFLSNKHKDDRFASNTTRKADSVTSL